MGTDEAHFFPGRCGMIGLASREIGQTGLRVSELGFGAAALGNLYRPVGNAAAQQTLEAALAAGLTYFDTAPFYGFGLSERRVGDALRECPNAVLSTKVGRLLVPDATVTDDRERHGFRSAQPFRPVYDYTHDGVMRSFEDSLQRLGLTRINLLYVHDIGSLTHGCEAPRHFEALTRGGGLSALGRLRDEGVIDAFGIGVNEVQVCLDVMAEARLDVILLAGRYTLLEQAALVDLFPKCEAAGTSVIVGGPYNSGILATGTHTVETLFYDYAPAPPNIVAKVAAIERVCERHDVPLAAAALQFPLGHRSVSSVIPGMGSQRRIRQTLDLFTHVIPDVFWAELKAEGLVAEDAPTPS